MGLCHAGGCVRRILLALFVAAIAAPGIWLYWPHRALDARFAARDCRPVAVTDAGTGRALVGIEDIALLTDGRLVLSAHDRIAAAQGAPPDGGLFLLGQQALDGPSAARATRLRSLQNEITAPHGIGTSGTLLGVVERRYGTEGHISTGIGFYEIDDDQIVPITRIDRPALCAANDILLLRTSTGDVRAEVTLDRGDCPGLSWHDMVWPEGRAGLVTITNSAGEPQVTPHSSRYTSANGLTVAALSTTALTLVAETRKNRLIREDGATFPLPGAPDNLTGGSGGRVVAALHPSLLRLALYRYGWTNAAPTRIVQVSQPEGEVEVLFDDPAGTLFSAATVGILSDGRLIAGSVRDAGLLVCEAT